MEVGRGRDALLLYFSAALLEARVFAKRFHSVLGVVLKQPKPFLLLTLPHGSSDMEFCAGVGGWCHRLAALAQ